MPNKATDNFNLETRFRQEDRADAESPQLVT